MGRLIPGQMSGQVETNPFSTRFIRPGAIEYCFASGRDVVECLAEFQRNDYRGQVVGPHGSGKSTLLRFLQAELDRTSDIRWTQVAPRSSGRSWFSTDEPGGPAATTTTSSDRLRRSIWIVDGFDSLSWLARRRILRVCRKKRIGLLVSTHRNLGLPTLCQTGLTAAEFERLVEQLMSHSHYQLDSDDVARAYSRHSPNIREALFELYDRFETLRRGQRVQVGRSCTRASLRR